MTFRRYALTMAGTRLHIEDPDNHNNTLCHRRVSSFPATRIREEPICTLCTAEARRKDAAR